MDTSFQLSTWAGEFGKAYTDRNQVDWQARLATFQRMLDGLALGRILEVGCNAGHNLVSLAEVGKQTGQEWDIIGVEPNSYALEKAREASPKVTAIRGSAQDLPFKDGYFDMAFTVTVLIHVSPDDLPAVLREILRVTRRYVLCVEYYAPQVTSIPYRGQSDLLWKRDFFKDYQSMFPDLALVRTGHVGQDEGFDDCMWWLLEKPNG